jgi:LysM repeat protein
VTVEPGEEEFSAICPYVGLADDADSHATYATDAHRCYRLPTPTRIALGHQETYCLEDNHTACPVFRGEGVQRTQPTPAAAVPPKGRERATAGRTQPLGGGAPRRNAPAQAAGTQRPRPARSASAGALNPRPRAGGVSMPVATIGLFAMAVVVILIAILIQQAVGGGGNGSNKLSPSDVVATQAALKGQSTRPASSVTSSATGSPGVGTPNPSQTPGTGTPSATQTGTPGAGGKTYTVQSGDTCGAIASASNITLQQLLDANKMTEADCSALQIGQVLKLP